MKDWAITTTVEEMEAAGTHGADTAAGAALAESTMGRLVLDALLPGVSANFLRGFQQGVGGSFHLFDGSGKCPILQSDFLLYQIILVTPQGRSDTVYRYYFTAEMQESQLGKSYILTGKNISPGGGFWCIC